MSDITGEALGFHRSYHKLVSTVGIALLTLISEGKSRIERSRKLSCSSVEPLCWVLVPLFMEGSGTQN